MPFLIHQALKDVRLLRWLLLAWILVLVSFHAIVIFGFTRGQGPWPVDAPLLRTLDSIDVILSLAGSALFVVSVATLVQNDSPAAATTFWVTRPISAATMAGSKLLTAVLVFCALPLACDVVDLLAAGIGPRWLPASRVAFDLAWILPLMAIAAITVGVSQFVLVAIIELLLVGVLTAAANAPGGFTGLVDPAGLRYPIIVVSVLLFAYQYLTRRTRRAAVMLAVAPIVVVGLGALIPRATVDAKAEGTAVVPSLGVAIDAASLHVIDRGSTSILEVPFTLTGLPDGVAVNVRIGDARLEIGDERIDVGIVRGGTWRTPEEARQRATRIVKPALSGATLLSFPEGLIGPGYVTVIARSADLRSAMARGGVLHLGLRLTPFAYRAVATVPARPGIGYHVASMSGSIVDARAVDPHAGPDRGTLTVRNTAVAEWRPMQFVRPDRYVLRNARLNQAILLLPGPGNSFGFAGYGFITAALPVSLTVATHWDTVVVYWPRAGVTDPSAWLRDAELTAITVTPAGETVKKTIDVPLGQGSGRTDGSIQNSEFRIQK